MSGGHDFSRAAKRKERGACQEECPGCPQSRDPITRPALAAEKCHYNTPTAVHFLGITSPAGHHPTATAGLRLARIWPGSPIVGEMAIFRQLGHQRARKSDRNMPPMLRSGSKTDFRE